jgi:hypothetical protein
MWWLKEWNVGILLVFLDFIYRCVHTHTWTGMYTEIERETHTHTHTHTAGCNWKVQTNFGHEFLVQKQEKCPYQHACLNMSHHGPPHPFQVLGWLWIVWQASTAVCEVSHQILSWFWLIDENTSRHVWRKEHIRQITSGGWVYVKL